MPPGLNSVRLPAQIVAAIASHSEACSPEECCGLIASDNSGEVRFAYPMTNADHSSTSFNLDPYESYRVFTHAESMGWSVTAVFHSHPRGPDLLSERDMNETPDSSWTHILMGPGGLKAFRVVDGTAIELEIEPA